MFNTKTFDKYIDRIVDYIKKNPPSCNDEFKLYTKMFYGIELTCKWSSDIAYYEVYESEDDYCKVPLYRCWEKKFGQYDGLKVLLDNTFGTLSCGGVGNSHYGSVNRIPGRTLEDWNRPLEDVHKYIKEVELLEIIDGLPE